MMRMPRIQLLSDETINQIAAGEVIENPACVVKELVENALDAGADKIVIKVLEGGLSLISVTDNGCGMDADDARRCLQRHATSKMRNFQDIFELTTMGFRGEALAAIGAVSKLTLTTSEGEVGTRIEMEGAKLISERPIGRARGTTIEVEDLFFNVPARKKFQKSSAALSAEIFRVVTQLALASPTVHFELISNRKMALNAVPCSSILERAELLIGTEFTQSCLPLLFEEGELKLEGLIGSPQQSRPNRLGQYLFLNGRAVQCASISYAIRDGYGTRLDEKRHPLYLLHLKIPTDLVDINVHPQKQQVRLREERVIKKKIEGAVAGALAGPAPKMPTFEFEEVDFSFAPLPLSMREEPPLQNELPLEPQSPKILGLVGPYLCVEDPKSSGLGIYDLRQVRFRLFYDRLMKKEESKEKQGLLLPFTFDCTAVEAAMLLTHLEAIEELGFSIRPAGKQLFLVEALPPFLEVGQVKPLMADLSHLLQEFIGVAEIEESRRKKLAFATARFAKNRQSFNVREAEELLRLLPRSSDPTHSPEGDPIMVHLSQNDLQKLFSK